MALVFLDAGLLDVLDRLTGVNANPVLDGALVGLFTNNHVPVQGNTIADFVEAAWAGYARQPIASWAVAAIGGVQGQTDSSAVLIPNTTGIAQSAFGLLLFEAGTGDLLAAAYFAGAPVAVSPIGIIVQISARDADL